MADSITGARAILEVVDELWQGHRASLTEAFASAIHGLEELIRADDYHDRSRDRDYLERSLGPLGKTNLDLGALSNMLGSSSHARSMSSDRLTRVQALIPELAQIQRELSGTFVDSALFVDIESDPSQIVSLAEDHLERASRVFRTLRKAQMEVRSKYEPELHDDAFERFRWRELAPNELRHCPPFVVVARLDQQGSTTLLEAMSLLETNLPITILLLRSSVHAAMGVGADTVVPAALSVEMLPVAMRGAHFAQTCTAVDGFAAQCFEALEAPGPSVLSVLTARDGEAAEAFEKRANGAIRSRAFPIVTYDPVRADRFVDCFDLASNPATDETWTTETLQGSDSAGYAIELEEAFTFAHFASGEPELESDYTDPPEDTDDLVPMAEYLELDREKRAGRQAFIRRKDEEGVVVRKVVSDAVTLQCAERRNTWRTLREVSGIDNPHVDAARAELSRELNAQQQASADQLRAEVERLRAEMEATMAERERAAVATAVRNIVTTLAARAAD